MSTLCTYVVQYRKLFMIISVFVTPRCYWFPWIGATLFYVRADGKGDKKGGKNIYLQ